MPLAQEIFQEGIRIPPVKLVRKGQVESDIWNLILANVRTPAEREGDLLAQLMSLQRGDERLRSITGRYGFNVVARNMRQLQAYSEKMMRATFVRFLTEPIPLRTGWMGMAFQSSRCESL